MSIIEMLRECDQLIDVVRGALIEDLDLVNPDDEGDKELYRSFLVVIKYISTPEQWKELVHQYGEQTDE